MKKKVFHTIAVEFLFLSILLDSSIYFFHQELGRNSLWRKTILVLSAWLVFAVLLIGRSAPRGEDKRLFMALYWVYYTINSCITIN